MWQALETVPGPCCTDGEWRQLLGAEYVGASQYLRADGRLAMSYPCPAKPECGCIHRVVRHGTDRFVGVCACEPPRCSRQTLARGDLELVRVDLKMLGSEVAACLGIEPHHEVVRDLVSTWGLGTYRPSPGIVVPAYLTIQRDADSLERAVIGLSAHAGGAFGLVLPTRRFLRATIDALLNRAGGHAVALSEDASLAEDGSISARRVVGTIWAPCVELASGATQRGGPTSRRPGHDPGRAEALSNDGDRLLKALRKHARKPWPGSGSLCRDAGVASRGGRVTPMHRTAFAQAVQELVDRGIVDLRGKKRVRKGYGWDLIDPDAQSSRKS